jgi:hypothetical protein
MIELLDPGVDGRIIVEWILKKCPVPDVTQLKDYCFELLLQDATLVQTPWVRIF